MKAFTYVICIVLLHSIAQLSVASTLGEVKPNSTFTATYTATTTTTPTAVPAFKATVAPTKVPGNVFFVKVPAIREKGYIFPADYTLIRKYGKSARVILSEDKKSYLIEIKTVNTFAANNAKGALRSKYEIVTP